MLTGVGVRPSSLIAVAENMVRPRPSCVPTEYTQNSTRNGKLNKLFKNGLSSNRAWNSRSIV